MIIKHEPDRRTTITFEHAGSMYRATWVQPYDQSHLPSTIKEIVIGCRRGDQEQSFMMEYLQFNYKLSVHVLNQGEEHGQEAAEAGEWAA